MKTYAQLLGNLYIYVSALTFVGYLCLYHSCCRLGKLVPLLNSGYKTCQIRKKSVTQKPPIVVLFVLIFVPHLHHLLATLTDTPCSSSHWSTSCVDYTCTGNDPFASPSGTNCFEVSLHLSVFLIHIHIQAHIHHPLNLKAFVPDCDCATAHVCFRG